MAKKGSESGGRRGDETVHSAGSGQAPRRRGETATAPATGRPSALIDTRVIYCGDNLEQLAKRPEKCVDLVYIDPALVSGVEWPFNSNRNYEVFWARRRSGAPSRTATPARTPTSITCGRVASSSPA